MPKGESVEQTLVRLNALRSEPRAEASLAELGRALANKSNLVVAKAADIIQRARLDQFIPQLLTAFDRFMIDPTRTDKGCGAKTSIVKALYELEARAEDIFLRGIHHIQLEGVWGGSADTAAELRGICALGLVRCNYRDAMDELAELLMDADPSARLMGARAVAYTENEPAGAPLLRMKILAGDQVPDVTAECLSGLLKLAPRKSLAFVARFLDSRDQDMRDAAMMAMGDSRQPAALDLLKERYAQELIGDRKRVWLLPIAMTRLPQSIDFLMTVIADEHPLTAAAAIEAIGKIHHADESLRSKVEAQIKTRSEDELRRAFEKSFRSQS
jgi:HEAT repeat protein